MTGIDMTEVLPYLTYSLIIIFGVYVLPGLALVPRAIFDSRLAYAVPVMSALVVIGLARVAKLLGIFSQPLAIIATLALAAIACYRLWHLRQTTPHWPTMHRLTYLTSAFLMLPAAVVTSLAIFAAHDVIAFWKPWTIQHMEGLPYDRSLSNNSPYPQNYSYLLAWCFHLLGSANLQLPVKSGFVMLGISLITAIGMVGQRGGKNANSLLAFFAFIVLAVVLLYGGSGVRVHTFELYLHDWWPESLSGGFAEILLLPPIIVSIAFYLQYQRSPESPYYIWLATGAALVAGLARQEGYAWLMGSFPLLVALEARKRKAWNILYPVAIAWCMGLLWLMTEGSNPFEGRGVTVYHAFGSGERSGLFEQLQYVFDFYIFNEPIRAIVFAACTIAVLLGRRGLGIFLIYLIPSFFIWAFVGAHTPRHGLHIGAIAILLIAANGFGWISLGKYTGATISDRVRYLAWAIVCIIAIYSATHAISVARNTLNTYYVPGFSLLDARKNLIARLFGEHAEFVYREIALKRVIIWAPGNYTRGVFYDSNPLFYLKDYYPSDGHIEDIKVQIEQTEPEYLIEMGSGINARYLQPFIEHCSAWFEPVAIPEKTYHFKVYRINREAVRSAACGS